ncbi:unnamed protein product [Lampetra planeri]
MLTWRKTLTVVSLDEEDGGELIPQKGPGPGSPEANPEEAVPAEVCDSALRPSGRRRRIRSTYLADLLSVAVALVAEIELEQPEEDAVVREGRVDSPATAISQCFIPTAPKPGV